MTIIELRAGDILRSAMIPDRRVRYAGVERDRHDVAWYIFEPIGWWPLPIVGESISRIRIKVGKSEAAVWRKDEA